MFVYYIMYYFLKILFVIYWCPCLIVIIFISQ